MTDNTVKMTINCNGKLIDVSHPKIMGILNITPDSFFDGGKNDSIENAVNQAEKMIQEGAEFIDVGGYSSRPGSDVVSIEEEINRTVSVVELIHKKFPSKLSL